MQSVVRIYVYFSYRLANMPPKDTQRRPPKKDGAPAPSARASRAQKRRLSENCDEDMDNPEQSIKRCRRAADDEIRSSPTLSDIPEDITMDDATAQESEENKDSDDDRPGKDRSRKQGLDKKLKPISDVSEMFEDMIQRCPPTHFEDRPVMLRVATVCSGTDAPIFALSHIRDALQAMGHGFCMDFEHVFSCEIEPFKQGFIRRNLPQCSLIFRDIVELATAARDGTA